MRRARPPTGEEISAIETALSLDIGGWFAPPTQRKPVKQRSRLLDYLESSGFPQGEIAQAAQFMERTESRTLELVTDKSSSQWVGRGKIQVGNELYDSFVCIKEDNGMPERWVRYIQLAQGHHLMIPITSLLVGEGYLKDVENPRFSMVHTLAAWENERIFPEAQQKYLSLRQKAYEKLSEETGIHYNFISSDPYMRDTFNDALAHLVMSQHTDDPVFNDGSYNPLPPNEQLEQKLGRLSKEDLAALKPWLSLRKELLDEAQSYISNGNTLVNFDGRTDNIWYGGVRGDFERTGVGRAAVSLGARYVKMKKHVAAYNSFLRTIAEEIRQDVPQESLADKRNTAIWGFERALRVALFKGGGRLDTTKEVYHLGFYGNLLKQDPQYGRGEQVA